MINQRRVAICARYSTPLQPCRSLADQIMVWRSHAKREDRNIVEVYTDHEATGATLREREGIQRLIHDSEAGRFDIVVAEALDQISRN